MHLPVEKEVWFISSIEIRDAVGDLTPLAWGCQVIQGPVIQEADVTENEEALATILGEGGVVAIDRCVVQCTCD